MASRLDLGDIVVDVVLKDIKNIHLSVYPPAGAVRVSAPSRMSLDTIRVYTISKLPWIRQQQKKILQQERETPREYLERESHYVWGKRYLLKVVELNAAPAVELRHNRMVLRVRPGMSAEKRQAIIDHWYRQQIKSTVPDLIAKWEPIINVEVSRVFVCRMKTQWGSCNHNAHNIRLNTDLAKKPRQCLEYILVHELIHLLEPTHNSRFVSLMDRFIPNWTDYRDELNRLPVRHEHWSY